MRDDGSYCVVLRRFDESTESNKYELIDYNISAVKAYDRIASGDWQYGDILIRTNTAYISDIINHANDIFIAGESGFAKHVEFDIKNKEDFTYRWQGIENWIQFWEGDTVGGDDLIAEACFFGCVPTKVIVETCYECVAASANALGINNEAFHSAMNSILPWLRDEYSNISKRKKELDDLRFSCLPEFAGERIDIIHACENLIDILSSSKKDLHWYAAGSVTFSYTACSDVRDMSFFAEIVRKHIPLHEFLVNLAKTSSVI